MFEASWESLQTYRCPTWYRDAKLGVFLHWGPSSVAAMDDWYGRSMYVQAHRAYEYHVKTFGHPSKFGFKDLIPLWIAEHFDPDSLVSAFREAGAGYIVPVATFHDNYDLWEDSRYQWWNAVNIGPKRDICGLWKRAALEQGLRFGVSTHMDRVPSWFNTSRGSDTSGPLAGVPYDGADPANAALYGPPNDEGMDWAYLPRNAPQSWREHWYLRNLDLLDSYQPDLLYFDGGIPYVEQGLELVAHFYNENVRRHGGELEAVLNIKKSRVSGAYREGMCVQDLERSKLEGIKAEPWQTDTSIGTWFWRPNGVYESSVVILQMLADIVSKNGNLLLNVPLMPDGRLDDASAAILSDMAAWMRVNGEAIFGTRPWTVFGEGPTRVVEEYSEEIEEHYTPQDFRFTTRSDALYVIGMQWPSDGAAITIESLRGERAATIKRVVLLGHDAPLSWKTTPGGLHVDLPREESRDGSYVLKIE